MSVTIEKRDQWPDQARAGARLGIAGRLIATLDRPPQPVPPRSAETVAVAAVDEAGLMAAGKSRRWNGEVSTPEDQQSIKRRLLLREAGRAFSEQGFHNTTLDEVAVKLGISKTIFYHYFGNKNDILRTCVEVGFEIADGALAAASKSDGRGIDKITEFIRLYVEGITSEIGACAVIIEMKSLKGDDYKILRDRQRTFDRKLRKVVQSGIDDGSIDTPDAGVAVSWIMGAPTVLARWFRPGGRIDAGEIADQYAAFARRSLERR